MHFERVFGDLQPQSGRDFTLFHKGVLTTRTGDQAVDYSERIDAQECQVGSVSQQSHRNNCLGAGSLIHIDYPQKERVIRDEYFAQLLNLLFEDLKVKDHIWLKRKCSPTKTIKICLRM